MAAYTDIDDPTAYFQTILFASKGAITFDGSSDLQPDMIWNKNRDSAGYSHHIVDSVRGVSKLLRVDTNIAEFTSADSITSLNTDGFTIGNDANGYMQSGSDKIVTWGWKAGTSFTNDASATGIGTIDSTGSVNDTAGFSICTHTGTGSTATIKHGLSTAPKMIITKKRSATGGWQVGHESIGWGNGVYLNDTDASTGDAGAWNSTAPTSSIFYVGNSSFTNQSSATYVSYIFSERKGYSKFSSYTGNGNADGTFVYTGMKSSFIMLKPTSTTGNWFILDNKRSSFNVMDKYIRANQSSAEATFSMMDFVSNGVKIKTSDSSINGSGVSYIYMCFAENPFVTSTGIPTTAR